MDSFVPEMMETTTPIIIDRANQIESQNFFKNIYVVVILFATYVVIFVFGLTGNLMVIYNVMRHKPKQTVSNVFIANLAVANILTSLFVVPLNPVFMITKGWPFGSFVCHLWPCIYYPACYASTLTLASIAVNRYLAIVHPSRPMMKMKKLIIIIAIIWIVSIASSLPFGVYHTTIPFVDNENNERASCGPVWPSVGSHHIYLLVTFIILLLIPMIVIACFYIAMSIMNHSHRSRTDSASQVADKRRINRLLIAMAIVYCICWMPTHCIELMANLYWPSQQWKYIDIIYRLSHAIAVSSTCFNPLFYMWISKVTLREFFLVGPCFNHPSNGVEATALTNVALEKDDNVAHTAHCEEVNLVSSV